MPIQLRMGPSTTTASEPWCEPGLDAVLDMAVVLAHVIERVHTAEDLVPSLAEAASLAARGLGFGTVTINLTRPLHDDFPVVVCEGPTADRDALLGTAVPRRTTDVVLQPRFERLGCYLILAGELDWDAQFDAPMYTPDIAPSEDPRRWNADDALVLPLRARDGELLGLMWLDEPLDGLRPSDAQLQLGAVIARHAAHAVEEATAVVRAHEHRLALTHLLATSVPRARRGRWAARLRGQQTAAAVHLSGVRPPARTPGVRAGAVRRRRLQAHQRPRRPPRR
jgi:hypothetical protein